MKTELIPVIHMVSAEQVMANAEICVQCGIKKVFIINHVVDVDELIQCAYRVKIKNSPLWVGINMLGLTAEEAITTPLNGLDGIWCDSSLPTDKAYLKKEFRGMFFGGLAFKYQTQPKDLQLACEESKIVTDVATTSGSGTGKAPTTVKIKTIREYLGDHPMAIASGVSVDNIESYKGLADYLLVASSITDNNEMIIKEKLVELNTKLD